MTATVAKIPDPLTVLRRAEQKATGEEPGDLTHLADAVRAHIIGPLTAGGTPVVDDVQVKQLQFDKQRLQDLVDELRKHVDARDGSLDRQKQAFDALKGDLGRLKTERDEARAERDTARAQLRDRPASGVDASLLEQAQRDNARLADELAQTQEQLANTRRDLRAANHTLDEIADDEASRPAARHRCSFPAAEPGAEPGPCECGKPWPRSAAAVETEEVIPDVEPWGDLFGQIRTELGERWSA